MSTSATEKPAIILDPHFRRIDEIFDTADLRRLHGLAHVVRGRDEPIPDDAL